MPPLPQLSAGLSNPDARSVHAPRAPHRSARRGVALLAALLGALSLAGCEHAQTDAPGPQTLADAHDAAVASAKGRVDIEGGVIRLAARRDGVIADVLVEEGQRVSAGQLLATLDDALAQRNLTLARSETAEAEAMLRKAQIEQTAQAREAERLRPLAAARTVAAQDYDRARDARNLAATAVDSARLAIATSRAREAVAAREIEERRILAPMDGRIVQRQARPGNGVSTLNVTPLFLFVPDVPHIVRAELEEQYIAAVRAGQRAEIVLEADASQRWRGSVLRIGRVVGQRTPSEDPGERQDNRVVEVVIALEGEPLLIGQRVIVRFMGS